MSADVLAALEPELRAIPAADVRRPDMPVAVYHQEAHDLFQWIADGDAGARLTAIGLPPSLLESAPRYLAASRDAEARWSAVRSPRKPEEQRALETRGAQLRSDLVAAIRWNLRDDRVAMGALDRIVEGEGVADLVQDLHDLAQVVTVHAKGFAGDTTFDPAARAEEARTVSTTIRGGLSEYRSDTAMADAQDLRNRAWTALDDALTEIRAAGQYAFRGTNDAQRFSSAYERRQRRAQRRKAAAALAPTEA